MQSLALLPGSSANRWCSGNARREVIDTVPLPYAVVMRPHTDYLHRSEDSVLALRVGERYGLRAFIHESHNLKGSRVPLSRLSPSCLPPSAYIIAYAVGKTSAFPEASHHKFRKKP